jgi:hypothetical protein
MRLASRSPWLWNEVIVKMAIYLVPLTPLVSMPLYLDNWTFAWPVVLAAPAVFAGILVQRRFSGIVRILSYPYLVFWGATNFFLGLIAWMVNPQYFLFAMLCSIAALIVYKKKRLSETALAFGSCATFCYLGWQLRHLSWFAVGGAIVLGGLSAYIVRSLKGRQAFQGISRASIALCIFCGMTHPHSFIFHRLVYTDLAPVVTAQKGVAALYDYGDPGVRREIGRQVMAVSRVPGTDRFLLTYNMPTQYISVFDRGELDKIRHLWVGNPTSDMALFDPDEPETAYIGCHDRLLHVSTRPLKLLRELKLPHSKKTNFAHLGPKGDRLFLSQDLGLELAVIDRQSFASNPAQKLDPGFLSLDLWVDPTGNQVVACGLSPGGRRIEFFDLAAMQSKAKFTYPLDYSMSFCTVDIQGRRAFLSSAGSGKIRVFDLDSLAELEILQFKVGLRNLNFDADRRWLLVGNYFKGTLTVFDVENRRIVGSIFLGDRLRWVQVDPESGKWYATTSVGGFEIDPDQAFNK